MTKFRVGVEDDPAIGTVSVAFTVTPEEAQRVFRGLIKLAGTITVDGVEGPKPLGLVLQDEAGAMWRGILDRVHALEQSEAAQQAAEKVEPIAVVLDEVVPIKDGAP